VAGRTLSSSLAQHTACRLSMVTRKGGSLSAGSPLRRWTPSSPANPSSACCSTPGHSASSSLAHSTRWLSRQRLLPSEAIHAIHAWERCSTRVDRWQAAPCEDVHAERYRAAEADVQVQSTRAASQNASCRPHTRHLATRSVHSRSYTSSTSFTRRSWKMRTWKPSQWSCS
jgi:hypothetical protein